MINNNCTYISLPSLSCHDELLAALVCCCDCLLLQSTTNERSKFTSKEPSLLTCKRKNSRNHRLWKIEIYLSSVR